VSDDFFEIIPFQPTLRGLTTYLAFTRRQDKKTAAQTQMTLRSYLNRQQHILVVHFLIVLIVLSRQKHSAEFDSFAALILRRLGQ
jgi:hypothetical protein